MTPFLPYLADELGDVAVRLLDRRLNGVSLRQLTRDPAFSGTIAWTFRRLMRRFRQAALTFPGDNGTTSSSPPSSG